ncbi:MAG TPA: hypothetical protein VFI95_25235 [Terriglobales bacterium]|nr:hypothetical protein [Terriglobales bacterium]
MTRSVVFAFLAVMELGMLMMAVSDIQPNSLELRVPALAAPAKVLPFGIPVPVQPAPLPPQDTDCPADNVRKQSCEARYLSST